MVKITQITVMVSPELDTIIALQTIRRPMYSNKYCHFLGLIYNKNVKLYSIIFDDNHRRVHTGVAVYIIMYPFPVCVTSR